MYSQSFPHQFCWTLHSGHVHCNIHIFDNRHKLKTGTISIEDLCNSILLQILQCFPLWEHLLWDSAPQCPHHLARPCQSSTCEKKNTIYIYHIIYLISSGLHKLCHPTSRDGSTWSNVRSTWRTGRCFPVLQLRCALILREPCSGSWRYSLHVCLREVKNNLFSFKHSYLRHFS